MRGRAGMPAADSANSTRKSPVVMTYRPWSGALQTRLSPIGSTPRRISARAASRGASLVGDCLPIRRPSSRSSQYRVAPAMETMEGRSSFSWKARMRSSSERAGFVRMSFALRGAPCGDDADDTFDRLCGHHRKESAASTVANRQDALLYIRMVDVETRDPAGIPQGGRGLLEADTVLRAIDRRLPLIPVKLLHAAEGSEGRLSGDYLRLHWPLRANTQPQRALAGVG